MLFMLNHWTARVFEQAGYRVNVKDGETKTKMITSAAVFTTLMRMPQGKELYSPAPSAGVAHNILVNQLGLSYDKARHYIDSLDIPLYGSGGQTALENRLTPGVKAALKKAARHSKSWYRRHFKWLREQDKKGLRKLKLRDEDLKRPDNYIRSESVLYGLVVVYDKDLEALFKEFKLSRKVVLETLRSNRRL